MRANISNLLAKIKNNNKTSLKIQKSIRFRNSLLKIPHLNSGTAPFTWVRRPWQEEEDATSECVWGGAAVSVAADDNHYRRSLRLTTQMPQCRNTTGRPPFPI